MENRKKGKVVMNNKFDHIAKRLLEEHGWIRVPWFVPQSEEAKKEDLLQKLKKLERIIKNGR